MSRPDDLRLITRIAQMYYVEHRKQTEIAAALRLPQARISRLLKRAFDENIVRVTITPPAGVFASLEAEVRARYGIDQAIIAESVSDTEESIIATIGAAAAHFFETTIAQDEVIGLSSWSASLLAMIDMIAPVRRVHASKVVQVLGGIGNPATQTHAQHMVTRMAQLTGAKAQFLPAPGIAGSPESRVILLQDPFVEETLSCFSQLTMLLVGIGAMVPSKMLASSGNAFTQGELDELAAHGAVGDVGLRFFNAEGDPVTTPFDDRVIGITLDELKAVKRVVAVAGGARKIAAINAALSGGYLDVLVTDYLTAERLMAIGTDRPSNLKRRREQHP